MDMAEKDNLEEAKRNEDLLNYYSANVHPEWQLTGLTSAGNSGTIKGDIIEQPSCSNANTIDSFSPTMWDQPSSSNSLGFKENNVHHNSSFFNPLVNRTGLVPLKAGVDSVVGLDWTQPNAMLKGGMFLPGTPGFLPQSLAHFPADSGFIERAARYSCFSGGNFSEILNPFNLPESINPYSRALAVAPMHGSQEGLTGNGLKSMSSIQSHNSEMNMAESSKLVSIPAECVASDGNQLKNDNNNESMVRSHDDGKGGLGVSSNESNEGEFSGRGAQEEPEAPAGESSSKALGSKKRKRCGQDAELDQNRGHLQQVAEVRKDENEVQQKRDQNPTSTTTKPAGKNSKQGPEASDSPKEEYIHVRARRGQATNSHSLAERVRREKISERMKFLQDLVPGCSKVTGKAVMLDEIINYVQSLQRQVEFLSMKLATVNPRLDFNIEGLLAKDILQSRAGPSALAFSPEISMAYPPLHQSQQGLLHQSSLHRLGNPSDALRRSVSSQFTTVSNTWEDELHNIVQMGLNSSAPVSSQDLSGSLPTGNMKAEP